MIFLVVMLFLLHYKMTMQEQMLMPEDFTTSKTLLPLHQQPPLPQHQESYPPPSHAGNIHHGNIHHVGHFLKNKTIAGTDVGCKHFSTYDTTSNIHFPMCMGQTDQDLKNGMSIINLINSRGYLPTCRVMQLMLWMSSSVHENGGLARDTFVDVGANIGSCTVHMASLGLPVISVEPVMQHVETIRGSIEINPSFHVDLQHIGMAAFDKSIKANFGHGARNWGATEFHEVIGQNETFETELRLRTLDQVVGSRKVSLLKVDCEGCEWATLKGARRTLRRIPMIKIELVQPEYSAGNETVSSLHVLQYLKDKDFELFVDHWNEQHLYFGKRGGDVLDIDRMFGSSKHKLKADLNFLKQSAKLILQNPIDLMTYSQKNFLKSATDVIAIERTLCEKMKRLFL